MKILKEGNTERLKMVRRFECRDCGCVFECEKEEYQAEKGRNDIIFHAACPGCGRNAYEVTRK